MRASAIAAGLVAAALAGSLASSSPRRATSPLSHGARQRQKRAPAANQLHRRRGGNPRSVITPIGESEVVAQATRMPGAAAAAQTSAPAASAPAPSAATVVKGPPCTNPNALGVSRVVEIDTTGGPGFGFEHFKKYDFLQRGEVVLTFDDGPWPHNTPAVLAALADHCIKATFFPIGKHAT